MIQSKKINIIGAAAISIALIICLLFMLFGDSLSSAFASQEEPEYAAELFGVDMMSIEIIADEDQWQEMLDTATQEQYIPVDVIVNGTTFEKVGIRPKGNSSLTQVASSESDRYSFRLKFDEYIDGQTCFGLDSFVVNNMISDNSYMKEYLSYDIMKSIGVDCPYFGYADITVNDENWGLYLAVETYGDSYEDRVFGDTSGMMYNVKSMDMGQGGGGEKGGMPPNASGAAFSRDGQKSDGTATSSALTAGAAQANTAASPSAFNSPPSESPEITATGATSDSAITSDTAANTPPHMGQGDGGAPPLNGGGKGGGRGGNTGGSLEYTDDDPDSYSAIFENVVGKAGSSSDYGRVVEALKALSEGENLEEYFDVDQALRYLAAHTVVVNLDSYSSSMAQNYYLYENDGKVTILPWDYNMAFGGFQSGNASSVINFPIDTPVSGVEMSERPLIDQLLSNEEYQAKYHAYLQEILDNYFADGKFEAKVNELNDLISSYVEKDATKFCTYEDYQKAVPALITLGTLRAESIQGQLLGSVPSTTQGQSDNPDALIDPGDLTLSDLGSGMGGGHGGERGGGAPDGNRDPQGSQTPSENTQTTPPDGAPPGTAE